MFENILEPTYVEIVCEARLNPTEKEETIRKILEEFVIAKIILDKRYDSIYLVSRSSTIGSLAIFGEWVKQQRIIDTVRARLIRSITGNMTALYFNRQAATMGRLSLIDFEDNPPNGPIILQIISDGLPYIINKLIPRTWKGKELSLEEWEKLQNRQKIKMDKRQKDVFKKSNISNKLD